MKLPRIITSKLRDFITLLIITFTVIWLYPTFLYIGTPEKIAIITVIAASVVGYASILLCFQYAPRKAVIILTVMSIIDVVLLFSVVVISLAFRGVGLLIAFIVGITIGLIAGTIGSILRRLKRFMTIELRDAHE